MVTGVCEKFAACDPHALADWIALIDFADWPQQAQLVDGRLRPAMVTDLTWRGFGRLTDALVSELAALCGGRPGRRMLSVVMPGASIEPHADAQNPPWLTRVHVPLLTNESAWFYIGDDIWYMMIGHAYRVDIRVPHEVKNGGQTPRVHLMFDVLER